MNGIWLYIGTAVAASAHETHFVFSTECTTYYDWQSVALFWSVQRVYARAGLPIPRVTRLTACDDEDYKGHVVGHASFSEHVHPRFHDGMCDKEAPLGECNPEDVYPSYNKPGGVLHWLQHGKIGPNTEYVMLLSSNQVLHKVIDSASLHAGKGICVTSPNTALRGFSPEVHMGVKQRMLAAGLSHTPFRCAGGFLIYHISDLHRVAPLWLRYTQQVRADPDSWATGDSSTCPNAPPGCRGKACNCPHPPSDSEAYGHAFAASVANITHAEDTRVLQDLSRDADGNSEPHVLHYGMYAMDMGRGNGYWVFDKRWYEKTLPLGCLEDEGKVSFHAPPPESVVLTARSAASQRTRQLALYCAWTVVNATMDYVAAACGVEEELEPYEKHRYNCGKSNEELFCLEAAEDEALGGGMGYDLHDTNTTLGSCTDRDTRGRCCEWAAGGRCSKDEAFMRGACRRSCGFCKSSMSCVKNRRWDNGMDRADLRSMSYAVTVYALSGWFVAVFLMFRLFSSNRCSLFV